MLTLFWIFVGLMLGWFFFPRPDFMKNLMMKLVLKYPALQPYLKVP